MEQKEATIKRPDDICEIFPHLFISSYPASKQYKAMKAMNITHIVNVTDDLKERPTEEQYAMFGVLYYPLSDEHGFDILTPIETISFFINSLNKNHSKSNVLVHCSAGISRSASIIIGYCVIYKNMTLLNAYKHVKQRRKQIGPRPYFINILIKIEMQTNNSNESSMNMRDYTINLLHNDTRRDKKEIGRILDKCNGDYVKARNEIFSLIQ